MLMSWKRSPTMPSMDLVFCKWTRLHPIELAWLLPAIPLPRSDRIPSMGLALRTLKVAFSYVISM
jgi:hypothetical protein